jgi:hypothetical protein
LTLVINLGEVSTILANVNQMTYSAFHLKNIYFSMQYHTLALSAFDSKLKIRVLLLQPSWTFDLLIWARRAHLQSKLLTSDAKQ